MPDNNVWFTCCLPIQNCVRFKLVLSCKLSGLFYFIDVRKSACVESVISVARKSSSVKIEC